MFTSLFSFWRNFRGYGLQALQSDFIAGITVALVLIPQSMAYAQLAGLPPYYGLYASCIPPAVAALFGSSRQLATGPVAIVSLMTAAALEPIAVTGSSQYISLAIFLALLVGLVQFFLGFFRLGFVVNFLSYPVIVGFTNAAALIIATSQLGKFLGVYAEKGEHHYETVLNIIRAATEYVYWPTLTLGFGAFFLMVLLKRLSPRLPYVLIAVALATLISKYTDYQKMAYISLEKIKYPLLSSLIEHFNHQIEKIRIIMETRSEIAKQTAKNHRKGAPCLRCHPSKRFEKEVLEKKTEALVLEPEKLMELHFLAGVFDEYITEEKQHFKKLRAHLHRILLVRAKCGEDNFFFPRGAVPPHCQKTDNIVWRLKVGNDLLDPQRLVLIGGGEIVGNIPRGLPNFSKPEWNRETAKKLLSAALIISLLGYMEAISIAKALAARTGQKLDSNQELIGQGVANIIGSFFQSYPVSGSFSRSAVNYQAGAVSALSSVFTSLCVVVTLLYFTPLLYYLPQTVLAAVVMNAVLGLIHVKEVKRILKVFWPDGIICILIFIATLWTAPHLDKGIFLGVFLSIAVFFYYKMRPSLAELSLAPDGAFRDARKNNLELCNYLAVIRFNGPLFFANLSYIENETLKILRNFPRLRVIIFECAGLNYIDASGVRALELLVERLSAAGFVVAFSSFSERVADTLERDPHFLLDPQRVYPTLKEAVEDLWPLAHEKWDRRLEPCCPLKEVVPKRQSKK